MTYLTGTSAIQLHVVIMNNRRPSTCNIATKLEFLYTGAGGRLSSDASVPGSTLGRDTLEFDAGGYHPLKQLVNSG